MAHTMRTDRTTRTAARTSWSVDARVQGSFAMLAHVTAALQIRGERRGQRLRRTWKVTPAACQGSVCRRLLLRRQRGGHRFDQLTLRRTGPGRYAGWGSFYVALRCAGRVYPHGSRVPYRIALWVTGTEQVQAVRFARRIRATYTNRRRTDSTACPLRRSYDAATYTGTDSTPLPTPPTASFTAQENDSTGQVTFTDTTKPGAGGAPLTGWHWDFGDPASGSADGSAEENPSHTYASSGTYTVTLTALDSNGLEATVQQSVTVTVVPYPLG